MADGEDAQALAVLNVLQNPAGLEPSEGSRVDDDYELVSERVTSPEDLSATDDADKRQPEEGAESAEAKLNAEADDGLIEIPGEDGAEPEKIARDEVVEGFKNWRQFEGKQAEIVHRVQEQAEQYAAKYVNQHMERVDAVDRHLDALIELIQPPQMPPAFLKDPNSPHYNPDQYNAMRDQYDQALPRYQQVVARAREIKQYRDQVKTNEAAETEKRQIEALGKAWPEWSDPIKGEQTQRSIANGAFKHYGLGIADLEKFDKAGYFLALKDALAFRDMKAQAPQTKQKIEAKAAAVTKSQTASGAPRDRSNGQFVARDALSRLKKSNSDADALDFFVGHYSAKQQRPGR